MCMTSSHPTSGSGYASPSSLPYTAEELPFSACQLQSLGAATSANSTLSTPPVTSKVAVVSATSSPTTSSTDFAAVPMTMQDAMKVAARLPQQDSQSQCPSLDLPLPLRKRKCDSPQQRFAAFVAILLMHLDGGGASAARARANAGMVNKNYKLSIQAKALVQECCRRNQMGDKHFTPLQDSLSDRLYGLVGEYHWNRARTYLHIFLARHHGFHPKRDQLEEDRRLLKYPKQSSTAAVAMQPPALR